MGETRPLTLTPAWTFGQGRSWHWLTGEHASHPVVCEWLNGAWHPSNESWPVLPAEMHRRGWRWHSQIAVPDALQGEPDTFDVPECGTEWFARATLTERPGR